MTTTDAFSFEASASKYYAPALDRNGVEVWEGTKVKIPKGTMFQSTHPKHRGSISESAGTRVVMVYRIYRYQDGNHHVVWTGAGGYWFECLAGDVEVL